MTNNSNKSGHGVRRIVLGETFQGRFNYDDYQVFADWEKGRGKLYDCRSVWLTNCRSPGPCAQIITRDYNSWLLLPRSGGPLHYFPISHGYDDLELLRSAARHAGAVLGWDPEDLANLQGAV